MEKTFARKASGLVRGLSLVDAVGVGVMNCGILPSMWIAISLALSVYTAGNLIIATLISIVMAGIGFPLVWGILSGSMPRSGGEYIYNSRIIHPIIGIAESFGNAFIWLLWICVLAPYVADPGLTMLFSWFNMPTAAEFCRSTLGIFLISSLVNVLSFLVLAFGIKIYARIQRVVMAIGLAGVIALILIFAFASHETFVNNWNSLAQQYNSLDYNSFLAATKTAMEEEGKSLPSTWNWFDTIGCMVAGSWLFIYGYAIAFIAGEVKRPEKTLIWGNFIATELPGVLFLFLVLGLYKTVGFNFLTATAWVDQTGAAIAGFNLPWSPNFMSLALVITSNPFVLALIGASFIIYSIWFVVMSYLAFPRILFAWGMDRMGPKWFTDINVRTSTPIKNMVLLFILGEIGLLLYALYSNLFLGLSVTGMEIVTVFGISALSALLLPYVKKARHIWEASPYKHWFFLKIPAVTWGAIFNLAYLVILFVFFMLMPGLETFTTGSLISYIVVWALGFAWYFYWVWRNRRSGIDVTLTYKELPPD